MKHFGIVLLFIIFGGASNCMIAVAADLDNALEARKPLISPRPSVKEGRDYRLVVKFKDHLKVRLNKEAQVTSVEDNALVSVKELRSRKQLRFKRLLKLSEEKIHGLEKRARERSKRAQPDLAGIMIVDVPGKGNKRLVEIAEALKQLTSVEYVYLELLGNPPPGDIPPTTPDLTHLQTYFEPDPGIDVDYAWSLNYRGGGVRLSDCEYGWVYSHEDLVDKNLHPEPGQTPHSDIATNGWDEHGTAVMGELCGVVNAYGVNGMVPDASIYTYPEWTVQDGYRRADSIANAVANSAVGDIVLLEMQDNYAPAETNLAVWDVVKAGVDAGVIIVSAAGNGGHDLDGTDYETYMNRGDSGAIMVGGGTPDTNHNQHLSSCYGSRVNLQGWYGGVFTLGYGTYAEYGGDKNQRYRAGFSGTSGASPFVASACVIIQDKAQNFGRRLTPREMRYVLIETGIPQGTGGHVGPLPDLRKALDITDELAKGTWGDFGYVGTEDGSFERPFDSLGEAVSATSSGGSVHLRAGSTGETVTITKAVNIFSCGGSVVIGQ